MMTQGMKVGEINVIASGSGRSLLEEAMKERAEERRKALDACNCLECYEREMQIDRNLHMHWSGSL